MSLAAITPPDVLLPDLDLGELTQVVGRTSFGIVEIAGVLDTVDANAQVQLQILQDVSRAAEAAHLANDRVRQAIQGVVSRSENTLETVSNSVTHIREGAQTAQDLAAWVGSVRDQVHELGHALRSVQKDNNKIASIAANVNILAINASIEAARAGDAGRGFAVVADAINALSKKTTAAAAEISENVAQLSQKIDGLKREAEDMGDKALHLESSASQTDDALTYIASNVKKTHGDAAQIAAESSSVQQASDQLMPGFAKLGDTARQTSKGVALARVEANELIDDCEILVQITAHLGPDTPDRAIIRLAQDTAATVARAFENALDRQLITERDLFSTEYTPLPHTDPQQVMAPFTALTDRILPAIQEQALDADPQIVFCAAVNLQGYLPTHNLKFSQKQTRDAQWNAANCRNRRIFDDRVGLKSGQNTRDFLLQVYRRDMGGGAFKLMKDISAPIVVRGRHWGGFRIGFAA